jgi:hypothetical protein|uniref:Uncharacterized protein n=1 Tax=viral metagenome TaxID=1070528 RepID=A0A6C0AGN4_9ZZZZ
MELFTVEFPDVLRERTEYKNKFAGGPDYGQKCFMITVDGLYLRDRGARILYVFPTFIIICYKDGSALSVREHRLGNIGLRCLKLADFNHCSIDTIISVHHFEHDLERYRTVFEELNVHDRQAFEEEKVAQELKVVRQAFELEEGRQALERDREAFERERQDLERELAKYKGIVGNCLKEISTYLE